jgi:hypothetical protein
MFTSRIDVPIVLSDCNCRELKRFVRLGASGVVP